MLEELAGVRVATERGEEQRVLGARLADETEWDVGELVDLSVFVEGGIVDGRGLDHLLPASTVARFVELAEGSADPRAALEQAAQPSCETKSDADRAAADFGWAACDAAARECGAGPLMKLSMRSMVPQAKNDAVETDEFEAEARPDYGKRRATAWRPLAERRACPLCGTDVATGDLDGHIASKECARARRRVQDTPRSDDDEYEDDQDDDGQDDDQDEEGAGAGRVRITEQIADDASDGEFGDRLEALAEDGSLGESDDEEEDPDSFVADGVWLRPRLKDALFAHQIEGAKWLAAMDARGSGGIVGDEMGLGKTATTAVFLGALYDSKSPRGRGRKRSCLILAPTTMLAHWVRELRRWAPRLRCVVLHRSARAFDVATQSGAAVLTEFLARAFEEGTVGGRRGRPNRGRDSHRKGARVVLASYEAMHALGEALLAPRWGYVVLDEGQKIRNPKARISVLCKRVRTSRRILLSGTPVQNSLKELWSLVDFCHPGLLGGLEAFDDELAQPIRRGGFAGATTRQVELAYRSAVALRDLIKPLLLRRTKAVICGLGGTAALPPKTEQVLFCRLTPDQIALYRRVLDSEDVRDLIRARDASKRPSTRCFRAITALRQICNHPDIYAGAPENKGAGSAARSTKLAALDAVLSAWRRQRHRCAVFSQSRKMLDIFEALFKERGYSYARIDGSTPPATRQATADRFNDDASVFCMLCTTRTGGVGMSLIGADRVVLYDPDWNPQTDAQARERSWRLGQTKPVTVYRLVCAGTIEEKIYHRQIFKQALTNKILQDPKQRRLFSQSELADLFTLGAAAYPAGSSTSSSSSSRGRFRRASDRTPETADLAADAVLQPHSDGNRPDATQDGAVLEALWTGSDDAGVAAVFRHDALEPAADPRLSEDADRQARRAVRALQATFQPAAPGSAAILAAIRQRDANARADASESGVANALLDDDDADAEPSDNALDLVRRLRRFFAAQRRPPDTASILARFQDVTDPILFRSCLRQLADLRDGHWHARG